MPSKCYLKATQLAIGAWVFLNMDRASQTRCSSPRHGVEREQTDEGADHHPSFEAEQFLILSLPPIKTKHKHNVPPSGMAMEREERTVFMVIS